jgi:hypothetical protein
MPNDDAKKFPLRFVQAIPIGADLERVMDRFFLALSNHFLWQANLLIAFLKEAK